MSDPIVSVIIPTYCGKDSLKRAVDSALGQTCGDLEVIVVDDNDPGSEARRQTEEIMTFFTDPRVRYIRHEKNLNGSAARNTGVRHARGELLAFLDDDDILLPWRIREAADRIREGYDIVFAHVLLRKYDRFYVSVEVRPQENFLYALMRDPLLIGTGSNLFLTKELYLRAGGFDETLVRHQDYDFLVRVFSGNVSAGFIDDYSIIKVIDRAQNMVPYEKLKEIKEKLIRKYSSLIENNLTNQEKRDVLVAHHAQLLYTAMLENNGEGIREQEEILRTFDHKPGPKQSLRALIKRCDRKELTQKLAGRIRERQILAMLRTRYPECYAGLRAEGYIR